MSIERAINWVNNFCYGARALQPDTLEIVAEFTLFWNMFEAFTCGNHAGIQRFEQIADGVGKNIAPEKLNELLSFYKFRYIKQGKTNYRFDQLNFRPRDRKDLVTDVLEEKKSDPKDQVLSLLIIVYRIRNNLFHGMKLIDILNDQKANLEHATKVLCEILRTSGIDQVKQTSHNNLVQSIR